MGSWVKPEDAGNLRIFTVSFSISSPCGDLYTAGHSLTLIKISLT